MTAGAVSFFEQWMNRAGFQGLFKFFMTIQATFAFGAGLEFNFVLRVSRHSKNDSREEPN